MTRRLLEAIGLHELAQQAASALDGLRVLSRQSPRERRAQKRGGLWASCVVCHRYTRIGRHVCKGTPSERRETEARYRAARERERIEDARRTDIDTRVRRLVYHYVDVPADQVTELVWKILRRRGLL